ncbi:MAG: pyridoxal phosphate-dependent aminotransferase [Candidatus Aenigmarchaeota archaeon]|nr:pyridoxal phosphate-dependent aminotransferase [Candidatus Aenigmarchaeota archaeon]
MPQYSSLLDSLPQYPFAKVGRLSREIQERDGVRVINARIGIPDEEAPQTVKERMAVYIGEKNSTFGYPVDVHPERGISELIDAIIHDYKTKHGTDIKAENIAVTGWTKDVLHNLARLYDNGNGIIPEPIYPAYEGAVVLAGHKTRSIPTSEDSGWLPELSFGCDDRYFYFCDPNNPTGTVADLKFYEKLHERMKKHDIGGIFDKAYKDYTFDAGTETVSITQVPDLMELGYEVVSLSKHNNFVGIGLGWVVSSPENINRWLKLSSQFSQGVSWYEQKAGVEALTNPKAVREMECYMSELRTRRDTFASGLSSAGLKCKPPQATPYLWAKVPEGYDDENFVLDRLLNEAHVAFMPGSYFGGRGYFRATVFLGKEDIEEAVDRIKKIKDW